jgi:trk system potassium uptake protein TrkH
MNANRTVYLVIGYLLIALAAGMLVPLMVDAIAGYAEWKSFLISASVTGFVAISILLINQGELPPLSLRQAFLLTSLSWIALTTFAALPLALSQSPLTYTDAFFEAMSGLTTTGATVMTGLDELSPGILLWRAMLQWFGGIGIVVMAISVMPMLNVGGMQIFRTETSDTSEKILPRAQQVAGSVMRVYLGLSFICGAFYFAAGMSPLDAIIHAMTTMSTGGFSSHDESFGYFDSKLMSWIAICFMILSTLPFVSYIQFLRGRRQTLLMDSQVRTYLILCVAAVATLALVNSDTTSFTDTAFNAISILSGTGYATADYGSWGNISVSIFFALMFLGGCAGSTACGLKIFRVQVAFLTCWRYIQQLAVPNAIFILRYNGRKLSDAVAQSVTAFILIFFTSYIILSMVLSLSGLDTLTALSAAAATLANVGPGLGDVVGPSGNYTTLTDPVKWLLSISMLLGRLEFMSIFVLFAPSFWRTTAA